MADYSQALELNPNNAAAYNNRGFAHRKLGQYDHAIADYTSSLQIAPNSIKTLVSELPLQHSVSHHACLQNNRGYSFAKQVLQLITSLCSPSRLLSLNARTELSPHADRQTECNHVSGKVYGSDSRLQPSIDHGFHQCSCPSQPGNFFRKDQ